MIRFRLCLKRYMRNFIQFLKSKQFRIHFAIALGSIAVLLFIIFKWLNVYTRHGDTISVPDLKGLELVEAVDVLEEQGFRYVVDSIYTEIIFIDGVCIVLFINIPPRFFVDDNIINLVFIFIEVLVYCFCAFHRYYRLSGVSPSY